MPTCSVCHRSFEGTRCRFCGALVRPRAHAGQASLAASVPSPGPRAFTPRSAPGFGRFLEGFGLRMMGAGHPLRGVVVRTEGPARMPGRVNPWKRLCGILGFVALLPIGIVVWLVTMGFKVAFGILFPRFSRHPGGRSLLDELLLHHALQRMLRPRDTTDVFFHVIDTGDRNVMVRQEGDFQDGRIMPGNRVSLEVQRRKGAWCIVRGSNDSLQVRLTYPGQGWMVLALLLLGLVAAEYAWILGM